MRSWSSISCLPPSIIEFTHCHQPSSLLQTVTSLRNHSKPAALTPDFNTYCHLLFNYLTFVCSFHSTLEVISLSTKCIATTRSLASRDLYLPLALSFIPLFHIAHFQVLCSTTENLLFNSCLVQSQQGLCIPVTICRGLFSRPMICFQTIFRQK